VHREKSKLLLIDVRTSGEFEMCKIPESINFPYPELQHNLDQMKTQVSEILEQKPGIKGWSQFRNIKLNNKIIIINLFQSVLCAEEETTVNLRLCNLKKFYQRQIFVTWLEDCIVGLGMWTLIFQYTKNDVFS
jgi:hypothetical protein